MRNVDSYYVYAQTHVERAEQNVSLIDLLRQDSVSQPPRDSNDSYSPTMVEVVDTRAGIMAHFDGASAEEQLSIINELLCLYARRVHEVDVPPDFVHLSLCGIKHLECTGRVNVIYELAKGLGTAP